MLSRKLKDVPVLISALMILWTGTDCDCGKSYFSSKTQLTAAENSIASKDKVSAKTLKVTLVELGSVNCIPCRMMKPVIEKVEKKYPGQVKVIFHDVWTEKGKAAGHKFAVRIIPTQIFLDKSGKEYFRHEGFFSYEEVDRVLKQKGVN